MLFASPWLKFVNSMRSVSLFCNEVKSISVSKAKLKEKAE